MANNRQASEYLNSGELDSLQLGSEVPGMGVDDKISVDGYLKHKYGWRDNVISFASAGKGAAAPTSVADVNGWQRLSFGEGDEVFIDYHVNHDYALGTDAYPHIHWMPTTTMAVGETVVWEFSYTIAKGHQQGESLLTPPPTVMTITHTADGTEIAGEHMVTECSDIDAFDLIEPDTVISARVKRLVTGTYGSPVYGLMADLHYQSDGRVTVSKIPDFRVEV